jgi:hypothetical protein
VLLCQEAICRAAGCKQQSPTRGSGFSSDDGDPSVLFLV